MHLIRINRRDAVPLGYVGILAPSAQRRFATIMAIRRIGYVAIQLSVLAISDQISSDFQRLSSVYQYPFRSLLDHAFNQALWRRCSHSLESD